MIINSTSHLYSNPIQENSPSVELNRTFYSHVDSIITGRGEGRLDEQLASCEKLIQQGADVNYIGSWGTPLHFISEYCFVQSECCEPHNLALMELLLKLGADPNLMVKKEMTQTNPKIETPLHLAVCSAIHDRDAQALELLVRYGGDPTHTVEETPWWEESASIYEGCEHSGYLKVKEIIDQYVRDRQQ